MKNRQSSLSGTASIICFLALILTALPAYALTTSATTVSTDQSYTITYGYGQKFLQEKKDNGSWRPVAFNTNTKAFRDKTSGTYYYRTYQPNCRSYRYGSKRLQDGCTRYSGTISVIVYAGNPPTLDNPEEQEQYQFETRVGDINRDGLKDIFIRRLSGDPNNGVISQTLLQQKADRNFEVLLPTNGQLAAAQAWSKAKIATVLSDFNLDGYVDVFLKDLSSTINGVKDQLVFSSGAPFNGRAQTVTDIDKDFKATFSSTANWIVDKDFFRKNVKVVVRWQLVWRYSCYYSWRYERYACGWYRNYAPRVYIQFNPEIISLNGISLASALNFCMTNGELNAGSNPAKQISQTLERVLGDKVFDGILVSGRNLPLPHEDKQLTSLKNKRLVLLISTFAELAELVDKYFNYINHYSGEDGRKGIKEDRYVEASSDGYAYFTRRFYLTGKKAKSKLAMRKKPTGFYIFDKRKFNGTFMSPRPVEPYNGEEGGGEEIRHIGNAYFGSHEPRWIQIF